MATDGDRGDRDDAKSEFMVWLPREWVGVGMLRKTETFSTYGVWPVDKLAPLPKPTPAEDAEWETILADFPAACMKVDYGESPTACYVPRSDGPTFALPGGWQAKFVYCDQQSCAEWYVAWKTDDAGRVAETRVLEGDDIEKPKDMRIVADSFYDFVRRVRYENALWFKLHMPRSPSVDDDTMAQANAYYEAMRAVEKDL